MASSSYQPATRHSLLELSNSSGNDAPLIPFLVPEYVFLNTSSTLKTLNLPHPKTNEVCVFLSHSNEKAIQSLFALEHMELDTSCFYNDLILSNASTLMAVPVDPIFLLFPIVEAQASKHFITFDTILHSPDNLDISALAMLPRLEEKLTKICDEKTMDDLHVLRFSNEKALKWLLTKMNALADHLCPKKEGEANGKEIPVELYVKALEYLSEWVPESWANQIKKELKLDILQPNPDPLSLLLQQSIHQQKRPNLGSSLEQDLKKPKKAVQAKPLARNQSKLSSFFKKP